MGKCEWGRAKVSGVGQGVGGGARVTGGLVCDMCTALSVCASIRDIG